MNDKTDDRSGDTDGFLEPTMTVRPSCYICGRSIPKYEVHTVGKCCITSIHPSIQGGDTEMKGGDVNEQAISIAPDGLRLSDLHVAGGGLRIPPQQNTQGGESGDLAGLERELRVAAERAMELEIEGNRLKAEKEALERITRRGATEDDQQKAHPCSDTVVSGSREGSEPSQVPGRGEMPVENRDSGRREITSNIAHVEHLVRELDETIEAHNQLVQELATARQEQATMKAERNQAIVQCEAVERLLGEAQQEQERLQGELGQAQRLMLEQIDEHEQLVVGLRQLMEYWTSNVSDDERTAAFEECRLGVKRLLPPLTESEQK